LTRWILIGTRGAARSHSAIPHVRITCRWLLRRALISIKLGVVCAPCTCSRPFLCWCLNLRLRAVSEQLVDLPLNRALRRSLRSRVLELELRELVRELVRVHLLRGAGPAPGRILTRSAPGGCPIGPVHVLIRWIASFAPRNAALERAAKIFGDLRPSPGRIFHRCEGRKASRCPWIPGVSPSSR
jgi:hypothetical protein